MSSKCKLNCIAPRGPLPDKWVDTQIFPVMTDEEVVYERKDLNLFYRRKYFVYTNDRMRDSSYNLEQDRVARNTVEFRTEQRRKLKEEEAEAMAETLAASKEKKKITIRKKRRAKEAEKRWNEVNQILWNQQQYRNETQKRMKLMKDELVKKVLGDNKGKVKNSSICMYCRHR